MATYVVVMLAYIMVVITSLLFYFHYTRFISDRVSIEDVPNESDDRVQSLVLTHYWCKFADLFKNYVGQNCSSLARAIYERLTLWNTAIFAVKYLSTGFYMYRLLKKIYLNSRERIMLKQLELEEIEQQIQHLKTRQCLRDAEHAESKRKLARAVERLRAVRARVRDVISADCDLRQALESAVPWGEPDQQKCYTTEEDREYITTLLNDIKMDHVEPCEMSQKVHMDKDCGEPMNKEIEAKDDVVTSDGDSSDTKECRVRIVKVTNVYKVAYWKQYVRNKRLRRASQQAVLKKKIEKIHKLLESWQKSLSEVINNKLSESCHNLDLVALDLAAQAKGSYSKSDIREPDSDSDNTSEFYDEYSLSWIQNYRNYDGFNWEDVQDVEEKAPEPHRDDRKVVKDCEPKENGCPPRYSNDAIWPSMQLFILPEETTSQLVIEGEAHLQNQLAVI